MAVGKWHLGDQLEFMPVRHGFERFVGLPYSHNYIGNSSGVPPLPLVNGEVVVKAPPELSQLTATFTQESVNFIRTTAAAAKPFFLYIPHIATHVPLVPGVAFQGRTPRPYSDWTEELDWSVGQVLDTLRELKIDKNTLVIFTSDNGPWLSFGAQGGVAGPLRGGKFSAWEGGVRVPTLAWWPGRIPANSTCDTMISNIDILPTAVGLAGGGTLPNVIDGIDIWPLLSGQTTTSTREAIFYWSGMTLVGVRSGKWKLMVEAQPGSTGTMPQLYDLENDIGETTDVKDQHPDVVARLLEHNTRIAAQLGARGNTAPGIRPQGTVANPVPLLMSLPNEYK
jgi:arylsulfatase A